jgi:hypothetical protein
MTEFISLYDYLGKPAGSALGKKVYQFSQIIGAKTSCKRISYSPYRDGIIMTYEKSTLQKYFEVESLFKS